MPRINPINPAEADGRTTALLDGVQKTLGITPNLMRTIAQSPAVLDAYLGFAKALGGASLSPQLREQIALAVAGENSCGYCASAHTAVGRKLGLDDDELSANLNSLSRDSKTQAALEFARRLVIERGWVSDDDLQRVRDAGYTDGAIVELVATVALNLFSNYLDHVAQTEVDFPRVQVRQPTAA
ncbi:MAG: carboxymuconolactone decarboxylase family protein [Phycisphaerales bacterium]